MCVRMVISFTGNSTLPADTQEEEEQEQEQEEDGGGRQCVDGNIFHRKFVTTSV